MKNTRKIIFSLFVSILGFLLLFNNLSSQQTAGELFEKALYQEEAKGDLQKAIELYQEILKQFPEDREVAAKAQLQIGVCYEKLGLKEAQKAFQKVIDNYPEQAEVVRVAREKLSILLKAQAMVEKGEKEFKMHQIWAGSGKVWDGEPSPDGKYLSFTDWGMGDLAIIDVVTGKKRLLTKRKGWYPMEFALYSRWSPDGKSLAYGWLSEGKNLDMRIIGLDGSEPRILYQNKELQAAPVDWSPDGKYILAFFSRKYEGYNIGLVSVDDGSLRVLKELKSYPSNIVFSPDGRYIIYDHPQQEGSSERDIFLLSVDGKREIPIVKHPANDWLLGCMPDGKTVLFASNRTGTMDAWIIQVDDGKLLSEPELIKREIGDISPLGITREGGFYFSLEKSLSDVYVARLDFEKFKILGQPEAITQQFVGSNSSPTWSPDGKYLAYISNRKSAKGGPDSYVLCIRSEETGEVREVNLKIRYLWMTCWSPDGQSIFATLEDTEDRQGLHKIDIQTGDLTLIVQSEPGSMIKSFVLSFNREYAFYAYFQWEKKVVRIIKRDLETGGEKEVYRKPAPPDLGRFNISPDGQYLSFSTSDKDPEKDHVIRIIPVDGGEPRDLLKGQLKDFTLHVWTPDGKEIIFGKLSSDGKKKTYEVWRVPVEGGEPQKIGFIRDEEMRSFRIHPDRKRIAFASRKSSTEIWVMENFLPEKKK